MSKKKNELENVIRGKHNICDKILWEFFKIVNRLIILFYMQYEHFVNFLRIRPGGNSVAHTYSCFMFKNTIVLNQIGMGSDGSS